MCQGKQICCENDQILDRAVVEVPVHSILVLKKSLNGSIQIVKTLFQYPNNDQINQNCVPYCDELYIFFVPKGEICIYYKGLP